MNTIRKIGLTFATLTFLGVTAASGVHAQTVYVDTNDGTTDFLGTLNLQTGAYNSIAPLQYGMYGLGFGSDGSLYGLIPFTDQTTGDDLTGVFQISTTDATETFLGSFDGVAPVGASTDSSGVFTALSFSDGNGDSLLYTVDPVAGTANGLAVAAISGAGLVAGDGTGNVFASDDAVTGGDTDGLIKIDSTTGTTTYIGDTGITATFSGFFSGGKLYTFGFNPNDFTVENIYTLNTSTGVATLVAPASIPNGSAIFAAALAPAPEPSQYAAFGLGVLGLGALALKARRRGA